MTNLYMLLQILRTFEALAAHIAGMRFKRDMDTNMTCDMVSLDSLGIAISPGTSQAQVIRRLASDMLFA